MFLGVDVGGTNSDAVVISEDGNVVSLKEAQTNRQLWVSPPVRIGPFFPKDGDKNRLFDIYSKSRIHYYYRWFEGSGTTDFYLRQGEKFTRWPRPQGGNRRAGRYRIDRCMREC